VLRLCQKGEVKITAEKLCKAICGKTIDKVYCKTTIGNEFANKIRGSDVRCVETYGKNMVMCPKNLLLLVDDMR
jgi:formamidopyrimidine-DNA glycosylase